MKNDFSKVKRLVKVTLKTLSISLLFLCMACTISIYLFVSKMEEKIVAHPNSSKNTIIVLGASVRGMELSDILKVRMNLAVELFNKGLANKILLTGDGMGKYYSETNAMENFAVQNGIPQENLIIDPKGTSTFVSLKRAKHQYNVKSAFIITQAFHLPRAVWLASSYGIDATGVPTGGKFHNDWMYFFREIPATLKDFYLRLMDNI